MKKIIIASLLLWQAVAAVSQTRVIAHRGFWDTPGSAQNSITALQRAQQAGVYGSELDILLTSDGVPVVNHDDVLDGMRIEDTPYGRLKDLTLPNGEPLPTLEAYLEQGQKDPSVRLVLEIKPHSTTNREDCAVLAVTGLVERLGMEAQVEYISFSLNICRKLKEFAPEAQVAYLEGNLSPDDVKRAGLDGIDYHHSLLATHPDWVARAHALGLTVNAWTVNREEDMRRLIEAGADFITTDNPLLLQKLLSEKKK